MNTIRKVSPIALAIAALCAAPLAFASAGVSNSQTSGMNHQVSSLNATGNAVLSGNAGANAGGNIGFNIATGSQNQQANAGSLASNTNIDDNASSNASVNAGQAEVLDYAWQVMNGANAVDFIGNALQGAYGNIGVNMTSGIFNQQGNNMAASHAQYSDYANAYIGANQTSFMNMSYSSENYGDDVRASNETGLYGNVLQSASGNIGVNEAAGISNQQSNSLAIAMAANKDSEGYPIGATANINATQTMAWDSGNVPSEDMMYFESYVNNTTGLGTNALEGANGNIGANMASGNSNQQSNNTALSAGKNTYAHQTSTDYADATAGATQFSAGNDTIDTNVQDSATVDGNAGANASGNIGINVVAGAQNQQENGLAIASMASPQAMANASAPVEQVAYYNGGSASCSMYNSNVSGSALAGASGNIGLNVASGNGNQQVNTLAIASAK
ncbi:hypothetical protein [Acidithiobacillus acidisediminis]|uniref:hypothetical protein n=1 Tax=Acidithiobacillus acidisediminis TaxID=2937799 RepID=UPI00200BFB5E|nr:hypothetical protein [Acidithiobacillus sp. S30A2]